MELLLTVIGVLALGALLISVYVFVSAAKRHNRGIACDDTVDTMSGKATNEWARRRPESAAQARKNHFPDYLPDYLADHLVEHLQPVPLAAAGASEIYSQRDRGLRRGQREKEDRRQSDRIKRFPAQISGVWIAAERRSGVDRRWS